MISYMIKRFSKIYHFYTTYCNKNNTNYSRIYKPLSPIPTKLCYI